MVSASWVQLDMVSFCKHLFFQARAKEGLVACISTARASLFRSLKVFYPEAETGRAETKVELCLEDGGETWLKLQGWEDAGPTFHYVTSYYWAFSQLGVGNTATPQH